MDRLQNVFFFIFGPRYLKFYTRMKYMKKKYFERGFFLIIDGKRKTERKLRENSV